MKVKAVWFGDDGKPTSAEVEFSIQELAWIALSCGHFNWARADDLMPGSGVDLNQKIYDEVASIFNSYWEDGVDDYLAGRD